MTKFSTDAKLGFRKLCSNNFLQVSDGQIELLENYSQLLLSWNKKINLISRKDEEHFWSRHILGSISFLFKFHLHISTSMLDLGTGGGLPGIPLAILRPAMKFTLIDSIKKKVHAVEDILDHLKMGNVSIDCGRAEDLGKKPLYFSKFDYVISRAVAPVEDIVKWSTPFLKRESPRIQSDGHGKVDVRPGSMLLLKGGDLKSELARATIKHKSIYLESFTLPSLDMEDLFDKKIVIIQP